MVPKKMKKLKRRTLLTSFIRRFLIFAAAWLVLFGGLQMDDLWFVLHFVAAATAISMYTVLPGQWGLRPLQVVLFFPYFIVTAVRGGWDVARRVFLPKLPIDPGFINIQHDHDQRKTLMLVLIINLLPGTASSVITDDTIIVHVLDQKLPVVREIEELKVRIDKMFDPA